MCVYMYIIMINYEISVVAIHECVRYMNTNCVIFPSNIDAPLENWVNGRDESRASS